MDDLYSLKSTEELENIINAWLTGDDTDDTSNQASRGRTQTESGNSQTNKTESSSTKAYDDIDEAFSDLGNLDF